MKHIKHWLATIAMLLCSLTASAHDFEVGGIYYSITSAEDLTVAVTYRGDYYGSYSNEYSGAVSIPSTVTYYSITYNVTSIGWGAFRDCSNLTAITIPESVTSIGEEAFYSCSKLASITIPESVTSIGSSAFRSCSSLTSITLPEGVTSIGGYAFEGCSKLTSITLPEGVTSIGGYAFYSCSKLASITIPESVTSIGGYAFYSCSKLASITIPEGVTSIGEWAFGECRSLTTITLPENSKLTSIGKYAFEGCTSLTSITIPEGVTSIGNYAFYGCSSLTSITIPESVTSIGGYAFRDCSSLTSITCEAVNPPTAEYGTFNGVNIAIPIYVPRASISAYQSAICWNNFTNIQALPAPENITLTINQYGSGTYCSEYALDFSEVEGLKAYAATGFNTETGIVTLTRVMTSKPGMGLFIKGEPGEYIVPTLEKTSDNSLNMLVGTLEQMQVNKMTRDGCYVNYKYTIYNDELKFWSFDGGFSLGAGKAYLQIPYEWVSATEARSIGIRFDEGGTTDIEDVELSIQHSELIYDLMGRRVASPQKGNLYIINGKKVIY